MRGIRHHLASQQLFFASGSPSVALSLVEQTWHPVWCILTQVPLLFLVEVSVFLPALAKLAGVMAICQLLPDLPLGLLVPLAFQSFPYESSYLCVLHILGVVALWM